MNDREYWHKRSLLFTKASAVSETTICSSMLWESHRSRLLNIRACDRSGCAAVACYMVLMEISSWTSHTPEGLYLSVQFEDVNVNVLHAHVSLMWKIWRAHFTGNCSLVSADVPSGCQDFWAVGTECLRTATVSCSCFLEKVNIVKATTSVSF